MNPRQRKGMLFVIVTVVAAIALFVSILVYVDSVDSKVGPLTTVIELSRDVKALEPIDKDMLREVEVPKRWVSDQAVTNADDAIGLVTSSAYGEGAILQAGMIQERPGLQSGYREVAIIVDAETGVAGKVAPGDHVDIIATTAGTETSPPRSQIWVSNALVLEVGVPQPREGEDTEFAASGQGVPVTFALPVAEALKLAYVESFSVKLRLALRGAGDTDINPDGGPVYVEPNGGQS